MDSGRRSVFLSGTVDQYEQAFGTRIEQVEHEAGVTRRRQGELTVPEDIADLVEGVFGIQDTPVARPHFQIRRTGAAGILQPLQAGSNSSFTPVELARLYNFPQDADGSGQCIAIIELGGGYRTRDLATYFKSLHLATPKVKTIRVDGGKNQPSTPDGADGEVMLDIEVAAAVAPKAIHRRVLCTEHGQGLPRRDYRRAARHGNNPASSRSAGAAREGLDGASLEILRRRFPGRRRHGRNDLLRLRRRRFGR